MKREDIPEGKTEKFRVGYARVNITPSEPMDLWGYGAGVRFHEVVLDDIYLTCTAVTDAQDTTALIYTVDLGAMDLPVAIDMRAAVEEATGVSGDYMFVNATHTHSAPFPKHLHDVLVSAAVQCAKEAMADRKYADMYFGVTNTKGINFIRSYYLPDGSVAGVNFGNMTAPEYAGHTSQIDEQMRVLRFEREGGKDVVLANWQCHPHRTGGSRLHNLSSDIVGRMRQSIEEDLGCLFAYHQGGAGNIDPISWIRSEETNPERDYKVHGKLMAMHAKEALQNMTQVKPGRIKAVSHTLACKSNKEDIDKLEMAYKIRDYLFAGHTSLEAKAYAESLNVGINSYYHARDIINRSKTPPTFDVPFHAVSLGELAWSFVPGEFFDATLRDIRNNSPYKYNFTSAYTNDYIGYFPTKEAWKIGGYEVGATKVARGSAEEVKECLLQMLNKLYREQ